MSRLTEAAQELGITVQTSLAGSWVTVRGERAMAHVAEAPGRDRFFVWCDDPGNRAVESHDDPVVAIRAAVRRIGEQHADAKSSE